MAAVRRTIGFADHHVRMNLRRAAFEGDIANERKDLYLFTDRDLRVFLLVAIEKAQRDLGKRADGGKVAGGQMLFSGESGQVVNEFVALVEDENKRFRRAFFEFLKFHRTLAFLLRASANNTTAAVPKIRAAFL
jgi:hypothetical protein